MDLTNKNVTILGAQRSGQAAARLVLHFGGKVKISEHSRPFELPPEFLRLAEHYKIPIEWGGHSRSFIEESDLVVISPGVPFNAPPLEWARAKGVPVIGEIELASAFCPKPMIAVTGSNGKTTVVTLIRNIIAEAGYGVVLCGNVGTPFSDHVMDLDSVDYVVLEISSFQLETIVKFKPHVAVFNNFSQNHLDRHKDVDEYFEAKTRLFMNQDEKDFAVLNVRDERVKGLKDRLRARVVFFNERTDRNPNQQAAMAVAGVLGIGEDVCQRAFSAFKGVEHRMEVVRTIDGIDFINDSKATTVESGRWALESLERPIIMICGGRDKNLDYTVLRDVVRRKVKKMVVIGEAKMKLRDAFRDVVEVEECPGPLEEAVDLARRSASPGDCVILSPMCASFDMFKSYEHRGKVFKEIVKTLR